MLVGIMKQKVKNRNNATTKTRYINKVSAGCQLHCMVISAALNLYIEATFSSKYSDVIKILFSMIVSG